MDYINEVLDESDDLVIVMCVCACVLSYFFYLYVHLFVHNVTVSYDS